MFIPRGSDVIKENDIIFVLAFTEDMIHIEKYIGKERTRIKNVMILGGGRIGYHLAQLLKKKKIG